MSAGPASGAPPPEREGSDGSLRASLGGLTTRGRSFLAAGTAAAACAFVLGQSDLLRVGLLLAALPSVCVLVLHRTRHRVSTSRRLSPAQVPVGSETRVHLRIDNVSRVPSGLLMLQDRVPYELGPRPRFVLDRIEGGGSRELSYRVLPDLRGRYRLGPLQLRLTDPFGMCELIRSFRAYDTLTVVPRVDPLPPVRLSGTARGPGDRRRDALAPTGEDDVIPRGYRHGDDLRRVHWRSTARHGELMVRREEQPQKVGCTLLLDTRRSAYPGSGPGSAFEWAVSGAASVGLHLAGRGFRIRLVTDAGHPVEGRDDTGRTHSTEVAGALLTTLAVLDHSDGHGLAPAYDVLRGTNPGGREGLLVAFLGTLDETQAALVARMSHRAHHAIAFTAPDGPYEEKAAVVLREAGWTVLRGGPGTDLPSLWQQAHETTTEAMRP